MLFSARLPVPSTSSEVRHAFRREKMLALLYLILSQPLVILDSLLGPAGRWWEETAAPAARQLDDEHLVSSSADRISSDQCYSSQPRVCVLYVCQPRSTRQPGEVVPRSTCLPGEVVVMCVVCVSVTVAQRASQSPHVG